VGVEERFGRLDLVAQPLVLGDAVDEFEEGRDVGLGGPAKDDPLSPALFPKGGKGTTSHSPFTE
jgi:hypothetical protein